MTYRICVTKYGFADIEADSADKAIMIAEDMTDKDFDWSDFDEAEVVEEFEDNEKEDLDEKYWEVEFECDDSWSTSGIYSFFMKQKNEPNKHDICKVHGVCPMRNGLGNIVRIIDITDDLEHYDGLPSDW